MANDNDLEILKQLTGEAYEARRNAFLQSSGDLARLAAPPVPGDWRAAMVRRVLTGWRDHGPLYRRVLADLEAVDVAAESRTVVGISGVWDRFALKAQKEYKSDILPLCWEILLKHADDWPMWKLVAFLRAAAAVPDAASVDPVLWFLERTADSQLQDVAGQTLLKLPRDAVALRVEQAEKRHRHVVEVLRDVLERHLE
jgi:hypothetical protein